TTTSGLWAMASDLAWSGSTMKPKSEYRRSRPTGTSRPSPIMDSPS
ncbi:Beta-glucosidase, partial [Phytophthora palmivora]